MKSNMQTITIDDFAKVDVRIGVVTHAEVPSWSHWVMKLTVDFGDLGTRTIFSGIMKFYTPEDLVGKQFPFVINLEPKKIGPKNDDGSVNYSEGMMIMAAPGDASDENSKPVLFTLTEIVPNGTVVR